MSFWTMGRDRSLTSLRERGLTFDRIAAELSREFGRAVSRDAVASRLRRLGAGSVSQPDHNGQISAAKEMRAGGMSWYAIGKALGRYPDSIRRMADPDYAEHVRQLNRRRLRDIEEGTRQVQARHYVPAEEPKNPIYDPRRDGPLGEHTSLTGALMGDPPPGYHEKIRRAA